MTPVSPTQSSGRASCMCPACIWGRGTSRAAPPVRGIGAGERFGQGGDLVGHLQITEPVVGNCRSAGVGAEELAGDGGGRVAVSRVVGAEEDGGVEVVGD